MAEPREFDAPVIFGPSAARTCVFAPRRHDDKYRRGVVGFATGSIEYPGAARLGVEAAAHAGCGMVRYLGPGEVGADLVRARPETVLRTGRCTALVAGSGITDLNDDPTRAAEVSTLIERGLPVVLDAGALTLPLPNDAAHERRVVLTPHAREFARLARRIDQLGAHLDDDDAVAAEAIAGDPEWWARRLAAATGATVLLKGVDTIVASADGAECFRVTAPTSVLATAGSGDVLAGLIGALVAVTEGREQSERPSLARLAAAGAWIHGRAALLASTRAAQPMADARVAIAETPTDPVLAPVTPLEVAGATPAVIGALLMEDRA